MNTSNPRSHGVQVDPKIPPPGYRTHSREIDRQSNRFVSTQPLMIVDPAENDARGETTRTVPRNNNRRWRRKNKHVRANTNTRFRLSWDRKRGNKKILHSKHGNGLRGAPLSNVPGLKTLNVITANPDTLARNNNLENLITRMNREQIHVACIQETHLNRHIDKWIQNYRFINAPAERDLEGRTNGGTPFVGGVAVLIEEQLAQHIQHVKWEGGRILSITIDALDREHKNRIPITIVTTYAPHSKYRTKERVEHWNRVNEWLSNIPQRHFVIWGADANGQLARTSLDQTNPVVGTHTHCKTLENGNGKALYRTCSDHNMRPMNTWREGKKNNKDHATWISPDGRTARQIDYLMVRNRHAKTPNGKEKKPPAPAMTSRN